MTGTRKGMTGTRKGMTGTGHQTTANPDFASGQIRISRRRLPAFLPIKIRTNPDVCKLHPDKSGIRIRTNSNFTEGIARIFPDFTSGAYACTACPRIFPHSAAFKLYTSPNFPRISPWKNKSFFHLKSRLRARSARWFFKRCYFLFLLSLSLPLSSPSFLFLILA